MPIKARGIRSPRDGVRGSCGLPSVCTRNQAEPSAKAYVLLTAISSAETPDSLFIVEILTLCF